MERVEEALDTLLPMLPNLQYYRFNPSKITGTFQATLFVRLTQLSILLGLEVILVGFYRRLQSRTVDEPCTIL